MKHLVTALILATATAAAAPAGAAGFVATTVAAGLDNPRGLAFDRAGALYVAEAGRHVPGGPTTVLRGNVFSYSTSGAITRVAGGVQQRVVTGLPSVGSATTAETSGPADIAFAADGAGYVLTGLGFDPAVRNGDLAPGGAGLGTLYRFDGGPMLTPLADVSAFEAARNPAGGPFDSNPYQLATTGDGGVLVTDAGANALLRAGPDGGVSLVTTFPGRFIGGPPPISDSVPTGLAIGPDGNFYVGELTGFPFTQGAARIYRVTPAGDRELAYEGFTMISDLAFGADGSLYVLEVDSNGLATPGGTGALVRIGPDGRRKTLFTDLVTPTGLAVGPDRAVYVSNFSTAEGRGEVLRIAAVPEPASWALLIAGFGLAGGALRMRRARVV